MYKYNMFRHIKTIKEHILLDAYPVDPKEEEQRVKHQLVKLVSEQADITEGQADKAVEAVVGYFKTRLPDEMNDEIANLAIGHNNDAEA